MIGTMRQGNNQRRGRGRGKQRSGGGNRNQTFDSHGPNIRVRGTAPQLVEKYLALARDAAGSGDRVMAENYFQHADHYNRIYMTMVGPQDDAPRQDQSDSDADDDEQDEQPHGRRSRPQGNRRRQAGDREQANLSDSEDGGESAADAAHEGNGADHDQADDESQPRRRRRPAARAEAEGEADDNAAQRRPRRRRPAGEEQGEQAAGETLS